MEPRAGGTGNQKNGEKDSTTPACFEAKAQHQQFAEGG
tara:strand:- start:4604 stop:4717 length:114 start_codon:yes stop_codon:yes gene_type:complete